VKKPGKIVVWPVNVNSKKSRREGRKIPRSVAVEAPRLEEIVKAASDLGLSPTVVPNASPPREWWNKTGYVIVDRKGKGKIQVLKEIAAEIKKARTEEPRKKRK